jgi:hypothetical protein
MNLKPWIGLALISVYLGGGYLRIKAMRRSGATTSFGHPLLDNLFLLISGLLLAVGLGLASWLLRANANRTETRFVYYFVLLVAGGLLMWLCNGILRRLNKRRQSPEERSKT